MISPGDEFWNVQAREEQLAKGLASQIAEVRRAIELADRIAVIEGAAGFVEFQKALEDMLKFRQRELESCNGTDSEMRIAQGRCRQAADILALLRNARKNREALAQRLSELETRQQQLVRPDGKVTKS